MNIWRRLVHIFRSLHKTIITANSGADLGILRGGGGGGGGSGPEFFKGGGLWFRSARISI